MQAKGQLAVFEDAAIIIQRAWRRHIDIQVFKYYKELIGFQNQGDPSTFLKLVNPAESKLVDVASGTYVRFRLGGHRFPPNIYYKIFTYRPVQDMCANSPKDYTLDTTKRPLAKDTNNKTSLLQDGKVGWYHRFENNGWRIVNTRLLYNPLSDPVTWNSISKPVPFSHDKLQRKQDVERKRKQRKIHWLQAIYRSGRLRSGGTDGVAGGRDESETIGIESQELEISSLVEWSNSLDFDRYINDWSRLGTSEIPGLHFSKPRSASHPTPMNVVSALTDLSRQSFGLPTTPITEY